MPELPEIHTITEDLKKYATGALIKDIEISPGYTVYPENEAVANFINKKILKVRRIAKNIIMETEVGAIQMHLAMTGRLLLRDRSHTEDKWLKVKIVLEKNSKSFELRFCDMRMFGKVRLLDKDELEMLESKYGPEPLHENLDAEKFLTRIKSKNSNIKNVLLDQNIIAGMGNVYVTDALWISKIHPETKTKDFDIAMAEKLLEASREILLEGIKNRGISMSDYVDLFGKKGKQQEHFRIYGRDICPRCETKVVFTKINGRGTYFCANCQLKGKVSGRLL